MPKTVLITGGSGLVGSRLTEILVAAGYTVTHLGRSSNSKKSVKTYIWDIPKGFIEEGALENVNIVIHLAGAGVADKRWTAQRKQEILDSRVASTGLLFEKLAAGNSACETIISASAIGIYGSDTGASWVDETSPVGDGFLAEVTEAWEAQIARFNELKLRVVTLRLGIVLSSRGGAFPKIAQPIQFNAGAVLGSGEQYMSWIHIDDLCQMMKDSGENEQFSGVYNAVAPHPVTNREFTHTLADEMDKKIWLPAVPGWVLKTGMGEMAQIVLGGNRVSCKKIEQAGFQFRYPNLSPAIKAVLGDKGGN